MTSVLTPANILQDCEGKVRFFKGADQNYHRRQTMVNGSVCPSVGKVNVRSLKVSTTSRSGARTGWPPEPCATCIISAKKNGTRRLKRKTGRDLIERLYVAVSRTTETWQQSQGSSSGGVKKQVSEVKVFDEMVHRNEVRQQSIFRRTREGNRGKIHDVVAKSCKREKL